MANNIITSLLSQSVLKITDWTTKSIRWPKLKIKSVEIGAASSNADLPISTNQISADSTTYRELKITDLLSSKIINPTRIRITANCDDLSTLNSIINTFFDVTSMLGVSSKSVISDSMVITNLEIDQTPGMISANKIVIEMEQAVPTASGGYDPEYSGDENANGLRIQSPPTITDSVNSLYTRVSKLF